MPNSNSKTDNLQSDGSLLHRFRKGSEDAATAIYLRYAKRLQSLAESQTSPQRAVHLDAEGIVQSVFRTFFRRAGNGQYDVDDSDSLWKLLLIIAMNKIRSRGTFYSANKRNIQRNVPLESVGEANGTDGRDAEALKILQLTISELLTGVAVDAQQVVMLRIDGFQVDEIARKTQRSKRTVERVLQNFRKTLHDRLEL